MAIVIQQPGVTGLFGKLATLAGKSVQARREAEAVERAAEQVREMQYKKEMAMLDRQWQLQAEARARDWELEKMDIRSRTDFAEEERLRIKRKRELEAKLEAIDKADDLLSTEEKQLLKLQVITGVPVYSMLQKQKPLTLSDIFAQQIAGMTTPTETAPTIPAATGDKIKVINPKGVRGFIPIEQWPEAQRNGYRRV